MQNSEDPMTGTGDEIDATTRRPTWAEIDLDALASNFRAVRRLVGEDVKVMAVVKADAYGHGAVGCARRLAAEGAEWFAVALPEEGIELRRAGIEQPILCLEGFWEGQAGALIKYRLTPVVFRLDMAEALDAAAREAGVIADVHVKIDTGVGRLGVRCGEAATEFARALKNFAHLRVDGLMTHFAAADEAARDSFTEEQLSRFQAACESFRAAGHAPTFYHMANSAATFAHAAARGNMVRPGGVLYGLWRDVLQTQSEPPELRPVLAVRSRIILLKWIGAGETLGYGCTFKATRPTLVATLPIGYHDGYARALSNRVRVVVRGKFAPVVGRISMDLTLVDVTDIEGVAHGDQVTLIGADDKLSLPAEEIAKIAGTISYEITCGISARVPRKFKEIADGGLRNAD
ncbi:MAG TPA: alanine racemase [Pyrinomonadaceae bacterium]|jgi:alanine racemase|nr:alanine racemase [Pyrinomonadaceae bacterium]